MDELGGRGHLGQGIPAHYIRVHPDYPALSWKSRWWLQDGGALEQLCLFDLAAITYLWRPRVSAPGISPAVNGYRYRGRYVDDDCAQEDVEEEDAFGAPGWAMLA